MWHNQLKLLPSNLLGLLLILLEYYFLAFSLKLWFYYRLQANKKVVTCMSPLDFDF